MDDQQPVLPRFGADCVSGLVPGLLDPDTSPYEFVPSEVVEARAVVVLVIDGLGWLQLQRHSALAPTIVSMSGGSVTTVAPSTTAAALTSIVTGEPPGRHGVVGYRIDVDGQVLNTLRWSTPRGDARSSIVPEEFQSIPPFLGQRPVVVQNAGFVGTGFTRAHLSGVRHHGWRTMPTLPVEIRRAVAAGEPFVYAYYDGIDKITHEFGFGEHYEAELAAVDAMVADLMMMLPRGTAVVLTADHGLVDCTDGEVALGGELLPFIDRQSGEARFRWLHAEPGRGRDLLAAATKCHSDSAWVLSVDQMIEEEWFGPVVTDAARARLGDVALVAKRDQWFADSVDGGKFKLIGRHGSLTSEEMLVPMLSFVS